MSVFLKSKKAKKFILGEECQEIHVYPSFIGLADNVS